MSGTTYASTLAIAVGLLSFNAVAGDAEDALTKELTECAAYYQIASNAIAAMNAPQMQAVGDRLKLSGEQAVEIANKYQSTEYVNQAVIAATEQHKASMPNSKSLGPLMGKYKESCKVVISQPDKRLDYWTMATM
ncbi:hypothetical protein CXF83_14275 [Shewanella sp. Choline-02u-19]|jgi:hypothetical protein|uniref:hypothetical protein n=1 Tax=Shewanella TaxID=22 RepID=UPI000C346F38|nr:MULTISPECIES: hypothetical protein [Shewanella]MCL1057937.1 hypothetical protein [Shewanella gelidimarina]PKG56953.1 hypothetical protein CXF82_12140 [Shewanella sp. GutDb-MelDb]PKG72629.1 hypothetical protein CXF86_22105 [Shewanella sp. GutCb]PKH56992.1 hypothetical protein CXF84_10985 [Shewanella sp. Bg11-22]PKI27789.1 hypothetical protein CXF83_14275 [Shewanella sp. Choline-02u-19]